MAHLFIFPHGKLFKEWILEHGAPAAPAPVLGGETRLRRGTTSELASEFPNHMIVYITIGMTTYLVVHPTNRKCVSSPQI